MSHISKTLPIACLAILALVAVKSVKPIADVLSSEVLSWKIGTIHLSAHSVSEGILVIILMFTVGTWCAKIVERRINLLRTKASTREILTKFFYILFYFISLLVTLKVLGIDFTTLTVVGGGIFLGIGLGLQKVATNFLTGLALLFDKSFEIGDVLELSDGTTGVVRHTSSRYTLIETTSGKDIMIPNDAFFIDKVINWTHSSKKIRTEILIKISYKHDFDKIRALILETAHKSEHCIKKPAPLCLVKDVADGVVTFALQFWIEDAVKGIAGPESELRAEVWKALKAKKIASPVHQREVRTVR